MSRVRCHRIRYPSRFGYEVRCPRCGSERIIVPVLIPAVLYRGVWESIALDNSYPIDPADVVTCTICQLEGQYQQFEN